MADLNQALPSLRCFRTAALLIPRSFAISDIFRSWAYRSENTVFWGSFICWSSRASSRLSTSSAFGSWAWQPLNGQELLLLLGAGELRVIVARFSAVVVEGSELCQGQKAGPDLVRVKSFQYSGIGGEGHEGFGNGVLRVRKTVKVLEGYGEHVLIVFVEQRFKV